jgi:hypothetical protein
MTDIRAIVEVACGVMAALVFLRRRQELREAIECKELQ